MAKKSYIDNSRKQSKHKAGNRSIGPEYTQTGYIAHNQHKNGA